MSGDTGTIAVFALTIVSGFTAGFGAFAFLIAWQQKDHAAKLMFGLGTVFWLAIAITAVVLS